jgi:hypothetical protein
VEVDGVFYRNVDRRLIFFQWTVDCRLGLLTARLRRLTADS